MCLMYNPLQNTNRFCISDFTTTSVISVLCPLSLFTFYIWAKQMRILRCVCFTKRYVFSDCTSMCVFFFRSELL